MMLIDQRCPRCHTEGQIIRQLSGDNSIFSDIDNDKTIIDYVAVTPEQLESANSVAVGFYDPVRKSAVITGGTANQKYRLTVWEKETNEEVNAR